MIDNALSDATRQPDGSMVGKDPSGETVVKKRDGTRIVKSVIDETVQTYYPGYYKDTVRDDFPNGESTVTKARG